MGLLEETLKGKSLADYTNTQLRLALGAVLYTNTADMWKQYLNQMGYSGDVSQMLQKYYVDYAVPSNFRNYINAGAAIYSPQQLFQTGAKGAVYDASDLSTLYLDAAGTTAATVNGLVGLQLDKSAGLALGAEIKSSGAVGLVGAATAATYNTSTGAGTAVYVDGSNQSYVQWSGLAAGSWYLLTIQNTGANPLYVRNGNYFGAVTLVVSGSETKTLYVPETSGLVTITSSGGAVSFTVSTIKAASGNHRYQSTTGSKPILRGTPVGANLVTNGDFASGTGWTTGSFWAISGGTATKSAGGVGTLTRSFSDSVAGKVYRVEIDITSITPGAGNLTVRFTGGTSVIGSSYTTAGKKVEYIVGNGTNNAIAIICNASDTLAVVNSLEVYDVSAGQVQAPYFLQYDGVDDFLQTAAVDFTATDKMFVCAGVRKLSDAASGVIACLGDIASNAGSFECRSNGGAGQTNYFSVLRGNSSIGAWTQSPYAAPITNVISYQSDLANTTGLGTNKQTARINGASVSSTWDTGNAGVGNFGNYAMYFGRRMGATIPYNGLESRTVICGKTLSASELASTERWVAQGTGVTF